MNLRILILFFTLFAIQVSGIDVIRINQLGYLPNSIKAAVFLSTEHKDIQQFTLHEALSGKEVFRWATETKNAAEWGMKTAYRLHFSDFRQPGGYYLQAGETRSPIFRINAHVYDGISDFLLKYMRQQRCGFNPYLNDSCHTHDAKIVYHPTRTGEVIDVTGGWHDATDYLQYSITSINAVFQMIFAYQQHPEIWGDGFDARGLRGANGIPDILDEVNWGLDWVLKMNPAPGEMYSQIADDRDHIGFRLPVNDKADYGLDGYRPVYFVTGKPQGLFKYKNQSTGVSSIAGKYASVFGQASMFFQKSNPELAGKLKNKALEAWHFALSDTGYSQTACSVSPYFYEEMNFADDLELAATQLYRMTNDRKFLKEAVYWGTQEPVSPWIANNGARHYQSYPFLNMGHYFMITKANKAEKKRFAGFYSRGLDSLRTRGKNDPFLYGGPFIWCSNNLVAAAVTQARIYARVTGDHRYDEMEAALRDWLFGCNPWGTAMICGLPGTQDSPMIPHSSYTALRGETTPGGLVDGPVFKSIYNTQLGITLKYSDMYEPFNNGKAVYHDDFGDYVTNEPTMDGTACLMYYFSSLESDGLKQNNSKPSQKKDELGATIRLNQGKKIVYLVFTADSMFEGGELVLKTLEKNKIKASFFFTGNFLRLQEFAPVTQKIIASGHYTGAHSNRHLLYCDWTKRDSLRVNHEEFHNDLEANYSELARFGIKPETARWFMPPYEWYNLKIVEWAANAGLNVVNFTPGTGTNADYTTPDMKNYRSSDELFKKLMDFEAKESLNGAIILIHPGTSPLRKDKFYLRLDEIIQELKKKGYEFGRF